MGRILKFIGGVSCIAGMAFFASAALASSGATQGKQVFQTDCSVCHANKANAPRGVGPDLFGVVGRHAGTEAGYSYSNAMKKSGLTWTPAELKLYIADPRKVVPGNKMPYAGLHNQEKVDALVAYLGTLK